MLFGTMQPRDASPNIPTRSRKMWAEHARDDLIKLKMPYTWYRVAQDRAEWSESIQTILEHT